jgi:hypothetical protein
MLVNAAQILRVLHNEDSACFLSFVIGLGVAILLFHKRAIASADDIQGENTKAK